MNQMNRKQELGTLIGGGDNLDHYHKSDRFPPRDSMLWVQSQERVITVTNTHTVTFNEDILIVDCNGKTITLPAAKNGRHFTFTRLSGTNTIAADGAETIVGAATVTLDSTKPVWRLKAITDGWIEI